MKGGPRRRAFWRAWIDKWVGVCVQPGQPGRSRALAVELAFDRIDIGIAARTNKSLDRVSDAFTGQRVVVCRLPQKDLPNKEGVRLGTMYRMKGLEYQRVIVLDADDGKVPLEWTRTDRDSDSVQQARGSGDGEVPAVRGRHPRS